MKKIYLSLCAAMFLTALSAQRNIAPTKMLHYKNEGVAAKFDKRTMTGFENLRDNDVAVPPSAFARGISTTVGFTNYDLQTNGTQKPRIINFGNGAISTAWTFGTGDIAAGVSDRGSGYNSRITGGAFKALPTKRVETIRTGFTNLCADVDGNEYLLAHGSDAAGLFISVSKKLKGATTWTQSKMPTAVPGGELWASAAVGGANGKSLHVVACTDKAYKGMTRALVYFRSLDGGVTWDKKDVLLPGMDSTRVVGIAGDNYDVVAQGNNIAVAYFGDFEDSDVWISNNNGDTWVRKTVLKFPIPLYVNDTGYDPATLPADPNAPAGAIFTTDNSGDVFFDKNGKAHVVFGRMYVNDADGANTVGTSYYPGTSSMMHWSETYPKDSLQYLECWPDANADDSISIDGSFGTYFKSLTCMPSVAVATDGTFYMTYSSLDELTTNSDGDHYRHIYIIYSKDNGKTWSAPYDITKAKYFPKDEFELAISECVYPSLAAKVDNALHIMYQLDYTQGLHVQHPADQTIDYEDNFFPYVDIPLSDLPAIVSAKDVVDAAIFDFALMPNPATNQVTLTYQTTEKSDIRIALTDMTGRLVKQTSFDVLSAGKHSYQISLDVPAGLYAVQLMINGKTATQKVSIR